MFCTKCGAQVADGAKFCSKCGNAMPVSENTTAQGYKSATTFSTASSVNGSNSVSLSSGMVKYIVYISVGVLQLILWLCGGLSINLTSVSNYMSSFLSELSIFGDNAITNMLNVGSISSNSIYTTIPSALSQIKSTVAYWAGSEYAAQIPSLGYMTAINVFVYLLLLTGIGFCIFSLVAKKELFDTSIIPGVTSILFVILAIVTSAKMNDLALTYLHSSDIISLNFGGILLIIVSVLCIGFAAFEMFFKSKKK